MMIDDEIHELHEELDTLELELQEMRFMSAEYRSHRRSIKRLKRRIRTLEIQREVMVKAFYRRTEESGVHPLLVGVPEPYGWGSKCEVVQ